MSAHRQHGAPDIRPSAFRERLNDMAALLLLLGAMVLPSACTYEEDDDMTNLNRPQIEAGPLTADDLATWVRDHAPKTEPPQPITAECCSEVGITEPTGRHRTTWLSRLWLRLKRIT